MHETNVGRLIMPCGCKRSGAGMNEGKFSIFVPSLNTARKGKAANVFQTPCYINNNLKLYNTSGTTHKSPQTICRRNDKPRAINLSSRSPLIAINTQYKPTQAKTNNAIQP